MILFCNIDKVLIKKKKVAVLQSIPKLYSDGLMHSWTGFKPNLRISSVSQITRRLMPVLFLKCVCAYMCTQNRAQIYLCNCYKDVANSDLFVGYNQW